MISLFIDTSTHKLIIGIYDGEKELYFNNQNTSNDLSSKLLPQLKEAMNSINLSLNRIDKIYVVNGPGSFTGIRVGVTVAKILAWSLNRKIYPVSELQLLATTKTDKKYIVPMIDARRGYVYGAIYDKNLNVVLNDGYIFYEELMDKINELGSVGDFCFVSYDQIENCVDPIVDISKIVDLKLKDVNPHSLNPNYLKRTEAEEKLGQ